jgi:quercetin dioxygenase-like cupin family protein
MTQLWSMVLLVLSAALIPHPSADGVKPPFLFKLPKDSDVAWKEMAPGKYEAKLFGDEKEPGPYGVLVKWMPGYFTHPHRDSQQRYFYVLSGTWWVSSSDTYDPTKTYPLPAGSSAVESANTIHWDGAKSETGPAIVEVVGMGPVVSTPKP